MNQNKAYDTHNLMCFHCDIAAILHCVQADTLHANLQYILQVQMKTLCIYVGKQFTCFFVVKALGISVEKTFLCQKPFACTVHTAFEFTSLQQQWEKH